MLIPYLLGFVYLKTNIHSSILKVCNLILAYKCEDDGLLFKIITDELILRIYLITGIISVVIAGILWYVIRKIIEPKLVFSRN